MTARHAVIALIATAALLAGATSPLAAAKTLAVRIVAIGTPNQEQTVGTGTFTSTIGGVSDKGKWVTHKNPTTFVDNTRFIGRRGTFKAQEFSDSHWTITGGTKAYAGLTGKGTETETLLGNTLFRNVWRGTATR